MRANSIADAIALDNRRDLAIDIAPRSRKTTSSESPTAYSWARYTAPLSRPAAIGAAMLGWLICASTSAWSCSTRDVDCCGVEIEAEHFDRDEPVAAGLVRAKHGTERARTNLMENPERPECLWRKVQD